MRLFKINENNDLIFLFISLMLLLILIPSAHSIEGYRYLINIVFTFMVSELLFRSITKGVYPVKLILVSLFSVLLLWLGTFYTAPKSDIIYSISHFIFYGYLVYILAKKIISSKVFNNNTIFGSLSIYISAAFAFGYLFAILQLINPDSFGAVYKIEQSKIVETMIYFSFISITTLGYGDIYPHAQLAGSFVVIEVIFGQAFFAIVITKIVSLSLSEHLRQKSNN